MVSAQLQRVLDGLKSEQSVIERDTPGYAINVHDITSKAGTYYEKLRYIVDYKDEHTIRRNAIERIIKRKVQANEKDSLGLGLLQEMISGGYLPNQSVSEGVGREVQAIVNKFLWLIERASELAGGNPIRRSRMLSLMATEIDRYLFPHAVDDLLAEAFYGTVIGQIEYPDTDPEVLKMQTYIACRRGLLEDDDDMLFYALWLKYFPGWGTGTANMDDVAARAVATINSIERDLQRPMAWRIVPRIKNQTIYFMLIREIIQRNGLDAIEILQNPAKIDEHVSKILAEKYRKENERVRKSGVRAVIYIFVTKVILALLFELPYEKFILGHIDYLALSTNIFFHPLVLMSMTMSMKPLGANNTHKILADIHTVIRNEDVQKIRIKKETGGFFDSVFALLYSVLFVFSFGFILYVLTSLNFNVVSIILFLFFLALVSYFGYRVRRHALRWKVRSDNEGIISLLWNVFTLPIVRAGRWLSTKFSAVNIFVFILDFLIEHPFKLVLSILDAFISFLKEKKDEIN